MSNDRLDRAIDDAVRQMLDVEPRAGFRARVLARISDADHAGASGFGRKVFWLGAPLAAAAIVVVALLLPRQVEQPQAPVTVATTQPDVTPAPARPQLPTPRTSRPASRPEPRPRVIPAPADRALTAASFAPAEPATEIEPLEAITPIEVAPIAAGRIGPAEISVRPLNPIVELQIAPLNPSERRN